MAEVLVLVGLLSGCAAATTRTTDDPTTTTQVKIALLADPQVGGLRLGVATLHGVVTLTGTARSQSDVDRAAVVARKVRGVRGVTSEISVRDAGIQRPPQ